MKTDCAALRQSKTNPATAGSTTNTIASDDDENNDHDDGDSAKWACGRLRSCKLSQPLCHGPVAGYDLDIVPPARINRAPQTCPRACAAPCVYNYNYTTIYTCVYIHILVYIIIFIQPYHSGVYNYNYTIIYTCVYNYNYKDT